MVPTGGDSCISLDRSWGAFENDVGKLWSWGLFCSSPAVCKEGLTGCSYEHQQVLSMAIYVLLRSTE